MGFAGPERGSLCQIEHPLEGWHTPRGRTYSRGGGS